MLLAWGVPGPGPTAAQTTAASPAQRMAAVKSWGYHLQGIEPAIVAASPYDMVVVDYARNGTQAQALLPVEIAHMKVKPDGTQRLVLAYLSIGEAENYRYYWQKRWSWMHWAGWRPFWRLFGERLLPSWLGRQNPEWPGNYAVQYWHPAWQALIFEQPDSYLHRLVAAGFDGVYLDRVDAFNEAERSRPAARTEMIEFVRRLAGRARAMQSGFLVVPQNGEELLEEPAYRSVIDGIAKEDLLYGDPKDKVRNASTVIDDNFAELALLTAERKPVFAVEYLRDPTVIADARRELTARGIIPHFADRDLARLRIGDIPFLQPNERDRGR